MSAYALPGVIFPPIFGDESSSTVDLFGGFDPEGDEKHQASAGAADVLPNVTTAACPSIVAHQDYKVQVDSSIWTFPLPDFDEEEKKEDDDDEELMMGGSTRNSSSSSSSSSGVGISVKEARLDPVVLTKCLTSSNSNNNNKKGKRRSFRRMNSRPDLVANDDSSSSSSSSGHDQAIQFDLLVQLEGRKYTATRTLTRIQQLRQDLVRDIRIKNRSSSSSSTRNFGNYDDQDNDDDDDNSSGSSSSSDEELAIILPDDIPHVPDCHDNNVVVVDQGDGGVAGLLHSAGGFLAGGFTMIQALLKNYCPVMERWLSNVIEAVGPTSEILLDFLWEPTESCFDDSSLLQGGAGAAYHQAVKTTIAAPPNMVSMNNNNNSSNSRRVYKSSCSNISLHSIPEDSSEDDYDDDEEEEEEQL